MSLRKGKIRKEVIGSFVNRSFRYKILSLSSLLLNRRFTVHTPLRVDEVVARLSANVSIERRTVLDVGLLNKVPYFGHIGADSFVIQKPPIWYNSYQILIIGDIINGYEAETRINVTVRVDVLGKGLVLSMGGVIFILLLMILSSKSNSVIEKAEMSLAGIAMFSVFYFVIFFQLRYRYSKAIVFLKDILMAKEC